MEVNLKSEYAGGSPQNDGNYLVVDVLTNKEFVAKVFTDSEGNRKVFSGGDYTIHPLAEFDTPSIRWIYIHPLSAAVLGKMLYALTT